MHKEGEMAKLQTRGRRRRCPGGQNCPEARGKEKRRGKSAQERATRGKDKSTVSCGTKRGAGTAKHTAGRPTAPVRGAEIDRRAIRLPPQNPALCSVRFSPTVSAGGGVSPFPRTKETETGLTWSFSPPRSFGGGHGRSSDVRRGKEKRGGKIGLGKSFSFFVLSPPPPCFLHSRTRLALLCVGPPPSPPGRLAQSPSPSTVQRWGRGEGGKRRGSSSQPCLETGEGERIKRRSGRMAKRSGGASVRAQ
jgi:hypothetical protein